MKPMNQLLMNVEKAINELEDYAKENRAKAETSEDYLKARDIIEECRWMTYHKCEIIKINRGVQ